jgi:hypothetical protein
MCSTACYKEHLNFENTLYVSLIKNSKFFGKKSLASADTANWSEWHTHLIKVKLGGATLIYCKRHY